MPLRLEHVEGRQVWQMVCDQCLSEATHSDFQDARDDNWHVEDDPDWDESELEGHNILCDICFTLRSDDSSPFLNYEVRDAIIDHLRMLPGGQELDFRQGSALLSIINTLAMGGPQEDLEARLLGMTLSDTHTIETAHAALAQLSTNEVRVGSGFVGLNRNGTLPVRAEPSTSTTVFLNIETCELPEWVYTGAWVKRLSDDSKGRIDIVGDITVVLVFNEELINWRRVKNAAFAAEFEPLPLPRSRYERLLDSDTLGLSSAAGVW
jgi:hypothetical protein